jgi:hypothetical protein
VHGGAAEAVGRVAGDLHAGADVDVLLLEAAHHDVGDVLVDPGQDLGQALEDGDLTLPRSAKVLANSQPMAPPPITATRPAAR